MHKAHLAIAVAVLSFVLSASALRLASGGEGEGPTAPAGGAAVAAGGAEALPLPPQWNRWTERERNEWQSGLAKAREAVRIHARRREGAAVRACESAARRGVGFDDAVGVAAIALDEGLDVEDFEPLGEAVAQWAHQGLRGEALAETVRAQVRLRKQHREQMRRQQGRDQGQGLGQGPGAAGGRAPVAGPQARAVVAARAGVAAAAEPGTAGPLACIR
jgi:hypothetical protein